jgi:para-nitrobenzyl esterase
MKGVQRHVLSIVGMAGMAALGTACGTVDAPVEPADRTVVSVEGGQIAGATSSVGQDVWVYQGIPYAAPPVGELRWRPPQPVQPWDGVRDATQPPAPCLQPPFPQSLFGPDTSGSSEDCLYLNVWSSAAPDADEPAPVMVWIHGGALSVGRGDWLTFDGTALAERGVVLVTLNYRLGALGYLAHPLLTAESAHQASGNYGTLDQIATLEWVQQNIAAFGGDPGRVTIFGESAGSWSVNAVMASPLSRGLLHRAIGQSGGGFGSVGRPFPKADREALGATWVEAVFGTDVTPSLEAMRAVPTDALLAEPFGPALTLDGWVLPDTIANIFAAGAQHDIPVIVGSNADEGTIVPPQSTTVDAYEVSSRAQYGELFGAMLATYPASSEEEVAQSQIAILTDQMFGWEMREWARAMSTVSSPAYLYYFSRVPPAPDAGRMGAYHTAEIPYVFDNLGVNPDPAQHRDYDDTDRALSDQMASYWVNFASTGDPNGEGLPEWPAYDAVSDTALEFGDAIAVRSRIRKARLDLADRFYAAQRGGTP